MVHPFTLSFKIKGTTDGVIASFANGGNATGTLKIQDGVVVYHSPLTGEIKGAVSVTDNQWHVVSLTHYYAPVSYTHLALFGMLSIGSCNDDEPIVPPSPGEGID